MMKIIFFDREMDLSYFITIIFLVMIACLWLTSNEKIMSIPFFGASLMLFFIFDSESKKITGDKRWLKE